jgi:hypothetical protein
VVYTRYIAAKHSVLIPRTPLLLSVQLVVQWKGCAGCAPHRHASPDSTNGTAPRQNATRACVCGIPGT